MLSKSFLVGSTSLDETHAVLPNQAEEFWLFTAKYIFMKRDKIIYWVATALVAAGMAMSAFMYLTKNEELVSAFQTLGFPLFFISILGSAKLLGAIILVTPVGDRVKQFAYAGFLFTFGGAIWTHLATGTPWGSPAVFLVLLSVSYVFYERVRLGYRAKERLHTTTSLA